MIQCELTDSDLDSIFANQCSWDDRAPCFSVDQIVEISFGEGSPEALKQLALHAAECSKCRRDWAIARELYLDCIAEAQLPQECDARNLAPPSDAAEEQRFLDICRPLFGKTHRKSRLLSSSLLASAAALCFMAMEVSKEECEQAPKLAMRSAVLPAPASGSFTDLSQFHYRAPRFEWPSAGDGCSYTLSFYSEELDVLFQTPALDRNQFVVGEELSSKLKGQQPRYWSVLSSGLCESEQSGLIPFI